MGFNFYIWHQLIPYFADTILNDHRRSFFHFFNFFCEVLLCQPLLPLLQRWSVFFSLLSPLLELRRNHPEFLAAGKKGGKFVLHFPRSDTGQRFLFFGIFSEKSTLFLHS